MSEKGWKVQRITEGDCCGVVQRTRSVAAALPREEGSNVERSEGGRKGGREESTGD